MAWARAVDISELAEGERKVAKVGDQQVLLVNVKGTVHAVANTCPHMGARLARGEVSGDGIITCPLHHSSFRLDSGKVVGWTPRPPVLGRLLGFLRRQRRLPVYATKVEDGAIWVDV